MEDERRTATFSSCMVETCKQKPGHHIACQAKTLFNENKGEARAISGFVKRGFVPSGGSTSV